MGVASGSEEYGADAKGMCFVSAIDDALSLEMHLSGKPYLHPHESIILLSAACS